MFLFLEMGKELFGFWGVCNAGVNLTVEVATAGWKPSTTDITVRERVWLHLNRDGTALGHPVRCY